MSRRLGRERLAQLARSPRARTAAFVAGLALVTVATCLVAYPQMYFGFAPYDDEGYLLISLESFLDQGSLYDDVFTQYGPFYYELWGGVFSLLGLDVSHDNGRMATLVAWVLASLLIGVATYRITRSGLLGILAQMLAFAALESLTNEPMHAGGLTCVLVALILLIATFVREAGGRWPMAMLGIAIGALLMVKANVGLFALAATGLVCSVTFPVFARSGVRALVAAAFVLTPLVLMAGQLDQSWVRGYCLHVTISAVPVALLLNSRAWRSSRDAIELGWLAAGLLMAMIAISCTAVASGTSPEGLLDGILVRPLDQPENFTIPYEPSKRAAAADLAALVGFAGYLLLARSGRVRRGTTWEAFISLGSVLVGLGIALTVTRQLPFVATDPDLGGYQMALLAFAWVALLRPPGIEEDGDRRFPRQLLPPLAVLQALHAYPVAGSQVSWATFLLVPVAAVCVANGARGLTRAVGRLNRPWPRRMAAVGTLAALALALLLAEGALRSRLRDARSDFNAATSLNLNGAERLRVPPAQAQRYRAVAHRLRRDCGTFLSLPGLNSFYLWTGRAPPTGLNVTHWMNLLTEEEQRRVIEAAETEPRLCALEQPSILKFWSARGSWPRGQLIRFIEEDFGPLVRLGGYELSRRVGQGDLK